ncbi:DapH/DapD/GlmU-related protein [Enterococcus thailandicus]|uniref:DapH/DapD/GlmU-related protein n=1 Tax=Enterococcus thailandicus TaxID=417368 RepID=UPI0022EBC57C|nr:DapH/DapD/GlmU-related protein [Enterococcus thailandicus]MDA3973956.1 DapH/DapD/GlmU-related protein [Enterococcus thailandicus]MDA3976234.1 DapH/DapD/GlmU-related protein [Enterococcus thailandicus]MDA3981199.1 DapH/DapD/GlmU-related protein [Enterococcus thailandicus]
MERLLELIQYIEILPNSPLFKQIHSIKKQNERPLVELNLNYRTNEEILAWLEPVLDKKIDSSVTISQPFYSDFGRHISLGKNIFINQNVTFVDLGGITIEDHVLIGLNSQIITVNHLTDPKNRRGLITKPVVIRQNAWLGSGVTVLPGVTIGKNVIVAANSTVTKDVPSDVIVAGTPAKIIKSIE